MNNGFFCEEKNYKHFGNCLYVSNGYVSIITSLAFGIRILSYSRAGGENLFFEQEKGSDFLNTKDGWKIYGGHRLWFAPENEKTYWPDNSPVHYTVLKNGIRLDQEKDGYLDLKKSIEIHFPEEGCELEIRHIIQNAGKSEITGAPWAITAMAAGGTAAFPWEYPNVLSDTPNRFISLWNSTSLTDKRLRFSKDRAEIRQLPIEDYFKMGFNSSKGLLYYNNKGCIFKKYSEFSQNALYPDNNVNLEIFTCKYMIELETLAVLCSLKPGESCEHRETWNIQ